MSEHKHTPTPWFVFDPYASEIQTADQKTISSCWHGHAEGCEITVTGILSCSLEESAANAAHIVRAVNHHEQLMQALASILWEDSSKPEQDRITDRVLASAIYASARGESQ